jgi:3-keto-5-aminohexanoate cleavage enzyme
MEREKTKSPLILNVAFTGAVSDKSRNPAVPYSTAEILADARKAVARGAAVGHFHVRDELGKACNDPARYADLFHALKSDPLTAPLIVVASTSGRHGQTLAERAAVLQLPPEIRPDMASLTLSSLNFIDGASLNSPDTIRALATEMRDCGVKPEIEIFDLGMVHFMHRLIDEGLLLPPFYVNVITGNVAGAQPSALELGTIFANLPPTSVTSIGGIGAAQIRAHLMALAVADGLRTGLEDSFRTAGSARPASNEDLIAHAVELARLAGRQLCPIDVVRKRLALRPVCP